MREFGRQSDLPPIFFDAGKKRAPQKSTTITLVLAHLQDLQQCSEVVGEFGVAANRFGIRLQSAD